MSRAELEHLLQQLVARKQISAQEMAQILQLYDDDQIAPDELPTPAAADDSDAWLIAALLAFAAVGSAWQPGRQLSARQRPQARDRLRADVEARATTNAQQLAQDRAVRYWHGSLRNAVGLYTRQMAIAGLGSLPGPTARLYVDIAIGYQIAYVDRFATLVAARQQLGRPLSPQAVAARSRLYTGEGWAAYFEQAEQDGSTGWVSQWLARDDGRTCRPCKRLHKRYFLPRRGPFPGRDCAAGGLCRCRRRQLYEPAIYARLVAEELNQALAQTGPRVLASVP